ncbi:MAG: DALR domain-containing protein, partial [Synergistota bacterium]|nr:DALR domain-containing protein [Synergistota bacterium]
ARKKFNPLAIRLFMLGAHYRSPLSFSAEGIQQASRGAERLRNCLFDLQSVEPCDAPADAAFIETLENFRMRFKASMDDDFNTAGAIGALFESVRLTNQKLASGGIAFAEKESALSILEYADGILGVIGDIPDRAADSDPRIEEMVASREVARQQKNFAEADRLRGQLLELGVVVEDTASGPRWKFMEGDAGNCGENN